VGKRSFVELNAGALNNVFVTSRYKATDRNLPGVVEMKQQFKETPVLYYECVILDNPFTREAPQRARSGCA